MLDDGWYFKALSSDDDTIPSIMGLPQDFKSRKRVWGPEMANLGKEKKAWALTAGSCPTNDLCQSTRSHYFSNSRWMTCKYYIHATWKRNRGVVRSQEQKKAVRSHDT